jgi:hypothetical protein
MATASYDEHKDCIGDREHIENVKQKLQVLQDKLQKAQDQGTILEQRMIQLETLYARANKCHKHSFK